MMLILPKTVATSLNMQPRINLENNAKCKIDGGRVLALYARKVPSPTMGIHSSGCLTWSGCNLHSTKSCMRTGRLVLNCPFAFGI